MKNKVNPKREGFGTLTSYLMVENVAGLVEFIRKAFDGELLMKFDREDGTVMHAEMRIGDSMLMMGEPTGEFGKMNGSIYAYFDDCDKVYRKALEAGAVSVMEPTTMHHAGERYGGVRDLTGNIWWIATHVEDVTPEEEKERLREMARHQG